MISSAIHRRPRETKSKPRKRPAASVRAAKLVWPKRPKIGQHSDLGRLRSWRSRCKLYRVDQYTEVTGHYLAVVRVETSWGHAWGLVGRHRTLRAAQRACDQHARRVARGGAP